MTYKELTQNSAGHHLWQWIQELNYKFNHPQFIEDLKNFKAEKKILCVFAIGKESAIPIKHIEPKQIIKMLPREKVKETVLKSLSDL